MGKLSKVAWLYIGAVVVAAAVAVTFGPFAGINWTAVITLGLLVAASQRSWSHAASPGQPTRWRASPR